jgi:hypothetical protein
MANGKLKVIERFTLASKTKKQFVPSMLHLGGDYHKECGIGLEKVFTSDVDLLDPIYKTELKKRDKYTDQRFFISSDVEKYRN